MNHVLEMQEQWLGIKMLDSNIEMLFDESTMRFFQKRMATEIERRTVLLLAAEMGLGKTVAVLTALLRMLRKGKIKAPVLIVAPLRVAQETWPTEILKWEHTRELTFTLIRAEDDDDDVEEACRVAGRGARALARVEGHDSETVMKKAQSASGKMRTKIKDRIRREKMMQQTDLHVVNRELVPWLWRAWRGKWPYTVLVYDEASRLKGGKIRTGPAKLKKDETLGVGHRLSEFGTLAQVRPFFDRIVELSGTPAPNGLHDLWGPTYILDGGKRLHRSMSAFETAWFDINPYTHARKPTPNAFNEIMGRLKDVMISLREEDYLTLPPRIDNPVYVTLPPSLMQAYREFERTQFLEMHSIEAVNSGVLTGKLLQFANGSVYDENHIGKFVHDLKIKALESIVQEAAGAPILVAYEFQFDLVALRKRWPKAVLLGEKNWMARWNRGEIDMLICHPASAAHGLNMQFGGSIGVWYGLTWSLELFRQFIKRLHRDGQKADRVWMHYIMARGTADEAVYRAAHRNGATQDEITNAVRARWTH